MAQHVCPWWLAYTFDNFLRRLIHRPELILAPYLDKGMTAVDIGCGMGHFSLGMARMVGEQGRVIAVDLQQQMLDITMKRAGRANLAERITPILCEESRIGVTGPVDLVLAFWMVHETPDQSAFLGQVKDIINDNGVLLIAEPKIHVSSAEFQATLDRAERAGFHRTGSPKITFSHTAVLDKQ